MDWHSVKQIRILRRFWKRLHRERVLNNRSSSYYARLDNKLTIPAIITTGVSSFISLLSTSDLFDATEKQICSIIVGLLVGIATIISSISTSYGFRNKKEQFAVAADQYDKLLTKIEFEILNPNEDFNDFCDAMESSILDIKSNCHHLAPLSVHRQLSNTTESDLDETLIATTPPSSINNSSGSSIAGADVVTTV